MADQKIHEYPIERFVFGDDDYYDVDFWDGFIYQTAKIKGSVIKSAMLSGIAINLTAPSAFIVGGSPTDGTGTLTLTGAGLANQYIRGDGTLATLPTSGGAGNSVNYYLNGGTSASVATYYQMNKTAVIGTGVDFSLAGNGLISQWLTDVGDPNLVEIPAGNWNFEMYFSASSSGGTPAFYVEILKYNGTTFTSIANNSANPEGITNGTAIDLYVCAIPMPLTTLLATDRIALRVYIVNSILGRTIKHHTQDSHLSQVITTFSSGISSINGLTKQTQYLAVGTSGTDFAINSVTDTHTFNLPTASATKRGALSSTDWNTFNGKQGAITLTTAGTGAATFVANTLNIPTPSAGGSSGIFGISNSSGVYTYYATLTLAMTAATSGQTIEMFADVVETGAVTITLKNGVNINGNGHTYTLNNSGLIHALSAANSVVTSCNILNLNVIRTGSTGSLFDNSCLILGINASGVINCSGSIFRNSGSGCGISFNSNAAFEVNYAVAYATSAYGAFGIFSYSAKLNNCIGYGTSGGTGIRCDSGGTIQNCTGISDSGYGIIGLAGNQSNCVGISTSGNGFSCNNNSFNCVGMSTSGIGFECTNSVNAIGCIGISVSGKGFTETNSISYNCSGVSSSSAGVQLSSSNAYNITAKSTSSYALWGATINTIIYGGTIICNWNNVAGYGVKGNGGTISNTITNCTFNLSNASAPYLFNDGVAQAISMRGNTYKGGGVFNVNLTQAIVAIEDAQGNIFL